MMALRGKLTCLLPLFSMLLLWTPSTNAVTVTAIRLRNPNNANQVGVRNGSVEIQVNNVNTWGSICDDGFDDNEAYVVCRMLGYTNGGSAVFQKYGQSSLSFLMDDSRCTGDERNLTQCLSSSTSDCSRPVDLEAGVECNQNLGPGVTTPAPRTTTTAAPSVISGNCQNQNPTVQLYGKVGIEGTGFVQVQDPNGIWGYVCDDDWNEAAAKIVCAQLCYPTNYTAKPGIPAEHKQIPPTPVNIILDNVKCVGTENTLQDCPHGPWGVSDCLTNGGELAGVQCVAAEYKPPPPPVPILTCGKGLMVAQFSRTDPNHPNLEQKHLSVFAQPNCTDVTKAEDNNYVSITIPVDKCGTNVSRNGTHILYYNEIKYDFTSQEGVITRRQTYRVKITCSLPVDKEVTQRVQPLTEAVTQKSVGNFTTGMQIYRSDSFLDPVLESPIQIPLGEWLNLAVTMEDYDPRLKLVVTDCVTTPTGDTSGTVKKVLFQNKCSEEQSLSFYPISNFKYGFRFQPFKFVGYQLIYVHCSGIICLADDNTRECDRTCNNDKPTESPLQGRSTVSINGTIPAGRRKRSADGYYRYMSAESPAIVIYDPHQPGPEFGKTTKKSILNINVGDLNPDSDKESMNSKDELQPEVTEKPPSQQHEAPPSNTEITKMGNAGHTLVSSFSVLSLVALVMGLILY